MKCCLVVGHSKKSMGAYNEKEGISEFVFNKKLAEDIKNRNRSGVEIEIVYRDTYAELPTKINSLRPDFIIALHCNAFNKSAGGSEVLYWHKALAGKVLATLLQKNIVSVLNCVDRGIKPRGNKSRGARLLRETYAPCVIAEPFFIDNNEDLNNAIKKYNELVDAFIVTVLRYAGELSIAQHKAKVVYMEDDNIAKINRSNNLLKSFIKDNYEGLFYYLGTGIKGVNQLVTIEQIKLAKELLDG